MRSVLLDVVLGFSIAVASAGCTRRAPVTPALPGRAWTTTIERGHPLVGKIWDVKAQKFVEEGELVARIATAAYVLLGEKHDNPDHHVLQAALLQSLIDHGRKPDVAFEMIDTEAQDAVDAALAQTPADPDAIARATDWPHRGWPSFATYRPIFANALSAHLAIHGVNLSSRVAKGVMAHGSAVLGERAGMLFLDREMDPRLRASLEEELRSSHCGQLPEGMIGPMANAQRARDATIAFELAKTEPEKGAVLIAGDGHVRTDRAVPTFITPRRPNAEVVSVGILEVVRGDTQPADYAIPLGASELPFTYVWFTPRASDEDPCRAFRKPGAGTQDT